MNDDIDLEKILSEMAQLQREFEQAANDANQSIRQLLAIRHFGGSAEMIDPQRVVRVAVDANGAPAQAQVNAAWRDHYNAAELAQVISECVQAIDEIRHNQAQEYLEAHPEALDEITDAEVNAALEAGSPKPAAAPIVDPAETILSLLEQLPAVTDAALAESQTRAVAEPSVDDPVQIFDLFGMLAGIRVSPAFIERATNVQLNAALTQAIYDHNNPSDEVDETTMSAAAKLDRLQADSNAAVQMLMSTFQQPEK